ncbi:glycosyltransferase family 4 protein [Paenibacillus sp. GP183]|uniref:glycosyltransferase family 4 protein n=1 Tax=Paenibacillus sp. GP183 TaxID=1882751 RepID=UPI00089AF4C6|nr:glycosyltransferase family 4 protein [Paenibacillus sp. GP183]SEC69406.1 Glycosyltransferase involved in cell wall bisynthesis [Paenibacillus sp. GP183]
MKLAYVFNRQLPSPAIRGGAIQLLIDGVLPYLSEKHQITIISITDPTLPQKEKRDAVEYIRLSPKSYFKEVAKIISNENFDLIHVLNRPDQVPALKEAAPQSQFVLSLHNERFSEKSISRNLAKKSIKSVQKIITISNYLNKTVKSRFPEAEKKLVTVYSGVNLSDYIPRWDPRAHVLRNEFRMKYRIDPDQRVIFFAGRLIEKKGPHLLIKAMDTVLQKHKNAVLVISGGRFYSDDRMTDYIRSLYKMAKPLKKKVIFTKYIPAQEIPYYYLMADVFVCSSQWNEPAGRIHYEAMAAGVPIITTHRGGIPEIIKDGYNGLVLRDFQNPKAFAKAIDLVLSRPEEADRLSWNGRATVESHFQYAQTAEQWEEIYTNIVRKGENIG